MEMMGFIENEKKIIKSVCVYMAGFWGFQGKFYLYYFVKSYINKVCMICISVGVDYVR